MSSSIRTTLALPHSFRCFPSRQRGYFQPALQLLRYGRVSRPCRHQQDREAQLIHLHHPYPLCSLTRWDTQRSEESHKSRRQSPTKLSMTHLSQLALGTCVPLVSGLAVPFDGLTVTLPYATTLLVHRTQIVLAIRIPLVSGFAEPLDGLTVSSALRHDSVLCTPQPRLIWAIPCSLAQRLCGTRKPPVHGLE